MFLIRESMNKVLELVENGRVKIKVTETIDWGQIRDVHKRMETRKTTGKIVLMIPENPAKRENESEKSSESQSIQE
jgi:D-arabinose 1-dehydrogenase-like Zn-dependent alcohol dehydrogenase